MGGAGANFLEPEKVKYHYCRLPKSLTHKIEEGPTFAKGVWTVLCGMGGLAAALWTAARGDCWTSHLDGFVSNDRGELFTLERTETRQTNISHQTVRRATVEQLPPAPPPPHHQENISDLSEMDSKDTVKLHWQEHLNTFASVYSD